MATQAIRSDSASYSVRIAAVQATRHRYVVSHAQDARSGTIIAASARVMSRNQIDSFDLMGDQTHREIMQTDHVMIRDLATIMDNRGRNSAAPPVTGTNTIPVRTEQAARPAPQPPVIPVTTTVPPTPSYGLMNTARTATLGAEPLFHSHLMLDWSEAAQKHLVTLPGVMLSHGQPVLTIVDSGATFSIISEQLWYVLERDGEILSRDTTVTTSYVDGDAQQRILLGKITFHIWHDGDEFELCTHVHPHLQGCVLLLGTDQKVLSVRGAHTLWSQLTLAERKHETERMTRRWGDLHAGQAKSRQCMAMPASVPPGADKPLHCVSTAAPQPAAEQYSIPAANVTHGDNAVQDVTRSNTDTDDGTWSEETCVHATTASAHRKERRAKLKAARARDRLDGEPTVQLTSMGAQAVLRIRDMTQCMVHKFRGVRKRRRVRGTFSRWNLRMRCCNRYRKSLNMRKCLHGGQFWRATPEMSSTIARELFNHTHVMAVYVRTLQLWSSHRLWRNI